MATLGSRIRHVRDDILRVNQAGFADMLGFSRIATISDYEKNKRSPDVTTLCKIADLGSVSLDWLLAGKQPQRPSRIKNSGAIKVLGSHPHCKDCIIVNVSSVKKVQRAENFSNGDIIDIISIPIKDYNNKTFAIKIAGDSMSPAILDGSIVGTDTSDRRIVSGKVYAVWLNHEGVALKRIFVYPERVVLKPDNPTFPETSLPTSSIDKDFIIGRIKWVYQTHP